MDWYQSPMNNNWRMPCWDQWPVMPDCGYDNRMPTCPPMWPICPPPMGYTCPCWPFMDRPAMGAMYPNANRYPME
ncbi:MAG TPA: hypothetical protein GXZ32_00710 [Clostridiales bacterium]|nr:hypothetical protein [Clostridiales bacterium]